MMCYSRDGFLHVLLIFLTQLSNVESVFHLYTYQGDRSTTSEKTEVTMRGRSKRDPTPNKMADHYDVTWAMRGQEVKARLQRTDLVGDLMTYDDTGRLVGDHTRSGYWVTWGTYRSEDVDGVFLVHRGSQNSSAVSLEGYFMHDGLQLLIQPTDEAGTNHIVHNVAITPPDGSHHEVKPPVSMLDVLSRPKRQPDPIAKTVELKVFVDKPMRDFLKRDMREGQVDDFIRKYYAMLITFMDYRYETLRKMDLNIRIRGVGLHIFKNDLRTIADLPHFPSSVPGKSTSCGEQTLCHFTDHIHASTWKNKLYDHAMLLTGYDILQHTGEPGLEGIALREHICDWLSVSVIEFVYSVTCMHTAAHELAHVLGMKHDGGEDPITKLCPASANHIMSPNGGPIRVDPQQRKNWWSFSRCTPPLIRQHIADLDKDKKNCLVVRNAVADIFTRRERFYGQKLTLDQQCRFFMVNKAATHTTDPYKLDHVLCEAIICKLHTNSRVIGNAYIPFDGTVCGFSKWCHNRQCVAVS